MGIWKSALTLKTGLLLGGLGIVYVLLGLAISWFLLPTANLALVGGLLLLSYLTVIAMCVMALALEWLPNRILWGISNAVFWANLIGPPFAVWVVLTAKGPPEEWSGLILLSGLVYGLVIGAIAGVLFSLVTYQYIFRPVGGTRRRLAAGFVLGVLVGMALGGFIIILIGDPLYTVVVGGIGSLPGGLAGPAATAILSGAMAASEGLTASTG